MNKKKIIIITLLLTMCTATMLTSCGGTDMNGNDQDGERVTDAAPDKNDKETTGNVVDDIESTVEDIGSDIGDSITNPEDATHGKTDENVEENGNGQNTGNMENGAVTKHRNAVPNGK